jgi:putative nucleotidyltransferase with HDIG domain
LLAVIVWIALVVWLGLVVWSLSVVRAAAGADPPTPDRAGTPPSGLPFARRRRAITIGQGIALAGVLAATVLVSDESQWEPLPLTGLLALLVLGSDILVLDAKRFRIGGSFTGLVLAMALLGPAPAAAIGVLSVLVDQLRAHNPLPRLITNVAAWATFPLVGGLLIDWAAAALDVREDDLMFSLLILGAFMVANLLNFFLIAGDYAFHNRVPLAQEFRTIFVPVLPSELVSALLCVLVAAVYVQIGFAALALLVVVLVTFQYLLRELLISQDRAERLAALQIGVLTSMIETLALRDRMTARHSAAVARYAREIALAMGRPQDERDLVHTAGLLHDIGKFAFPDSILLVPQLTDEQWELVKRHPVDGARIVRRVEGYGPVADIILCHHERWDGAGYPRGLAGDEIPAEARILAVADAYEAMTADRAYRAALGHDAAQEELRAGAGTQFDPEIVEAFIAVLTPRAPRARRQIVSRAA